jgi:hypothetical protein
VVIMISSPRSARFEGTYCSEVMHYYMVDHETQWRSYSDPKCELLLVAIHESCGENQFCVSQ